MFRHHAVHQLQGLGTFIALHQIKTLIRRHLHDLLVAIFWIHLEKRIGSDLRRQFVCRCRRSSGCVFFAGDAGSELEAVIEPDEEGDAMSPSPPEFVAGIGEGLALFFAFFFAAEFISAYMASSACLRPALPWSIEVSASGLMLMSEPDLGAEGAAFADATGFAAVFVSPEPASAFFCWRSSMATMRDS